MKDDRLYLVHICECIYRIEQYTADGRETFLEDTRTQDAVLRNLHTIAESTQRLSPSMKQAHHSIDWAAISAFQNVVVHDYLGVNMERIWRIVSGSLPELKSEVESMLQELGGWSDEQER